MRTPAPPSEIAKASAYWTKLRPVLSDRAADSLCAGDGSDADRTSVNNAAIAVVLFISFLLTGRED
jgi:hypothetical protein